MFAQNRHDKNKLYSLHAPDVECIAKGKYAPVSPRSIRRLY